MTDEARVYFSANLNGLYGGIPHSQVIRAWQRICQVINESDAPGFIVFLDPDGVEVRNSSSRNFIFKACFEDEANES